MNRIELIKKALDQYWIYIHMGEHYDQEQKIRSALRCKTYIEDNGEINAKWLLDNGRILEDVFSLHANSLKQQIEEAYSQDDICSLKEERMIMLRLLHFLHERQINSD